ncbi:MAG: helix-turn-helix domain-containing protein [Clostridia bacterium]|nr:helix-turn-helix domain-containing protein [Clostridia bacterium]
MTNYSFRELCDLDFRVDELHITYTLEQPFRRFRCPKNLRRCDRFFFIQEGVFEITQDGGEPILVSSGDVLYLPGDCVYTSEWKSEEIRYASAEFILSTEQGVFGFSDQIFVALRGKGSVARDIYDRMLSVWKKGELGYRIKAGAIFLELLHHVTLENIKADMKRSHADISGAILYLENNYIGEISVGELAKMCGMCESRFRSRFLDYAGMPPIQYRNYLRTKKASELLSTGEYSVGEVAEMVGIPDVAYFNRVFRRFCGTTPSAIKNAEES